MGGRMPETCWAVNKRQDNKVENCCIWLVIYLNCTVMMHGLTNLKFIMFLLGDSSWFLWCDAVQCGSYCSTARVTGTSYLTDVVPCTLRHWQRTSGAAFIFTITDCISNNTGHKAHFITVSRVQHNDRKCKCVKLNERAVNCKWEEVKCRLVQKWSWVKLGEV
jgi:hypothetical protein